MSCIVKQKKVTYFSSVPLFVHFSFSPMNFFSVKDSSTTTWLRILKGTKLDSDELFCVTKTATYCLSVPLFVHFSFSPMNFFSVKDFSATTWLRILKFGAKLDSDELYCVTKKTHIACSSVPLFVHFSFSPMNFFVKNFSATTWLRNLKFGTKLDSDELYCVAKVATHCFSVTLFVIFFSPMKNSITDFSAAITASVYKFCVNFQVG